MTHLCQIAPTFLVLGILSYLTARLMAKCTQSVKYLPLKIIAITLLVLEVGKQIYSFGSDGAYNLYSLPFHYCSLFLYLLPFHAFYHGKRSYITNAAAFSCLASLMLDMLLMPAVIYSAGNIKNFFVSYGDFHTVAFHNLVVFYFILTVALKLHDLRPKRDLKIVTLFLAVYVIIAATLSYSLKVNFHNLYKCNIGFIENVRVAVVDKLGIFGTLIYVCVLFVLTILFAYAAYSLARLAIKGIDKARRGKAAE
jgi:hypothetical protein